MENEKKKYGYLKNLDKKVFKFLFEEYNKTQEENEKLNLKSIKEIDSKISNLETKLKSMNEEGYEDTLVYRNVRDEYEEALYEKSMIKPKKVNYVRSFSDAYEYIKLNPDENKFCVFLSNVLKIKPEEIKKLFGEDLNLIFKTVIDKDNHFTCNGDMLDEIENRYNANVNCFNITGKYIQNLDESIFEIEDKDNNILDFSEITELYDYNDMMEVYDPEINDEQSELPQYDGKYSYYALFSKKDIPYNFQDKIENTCYLKNLVDEISKKKKFNICYNVKELILDNNIKINDDPEIFKEAIYKIVMFFVNQREKYGSGFEYDNEKYDDEYKKLISEISEKYCTNYQDKDKKQLNKLI